MTPESLDPPDEIKPLSREWFVEEGFSFIILFFLGFIASLGGQGLEVALGGEKGVSLRGSVLTGILAGLGRGLSYWQYIRGLQKW